ncbi:MAG: methylmalonyl-CoA mutase family protein, partial [Microthrixaceae bacterium]
MAAQAEPTFAGDFPSVSEEQWREAVDRVLKGAPFDRLLSSTSDGVVVEPLYVSGPDDTETGAPGASPYTRGFAPGQRTGGAWDVRAPVVLDDPAAANATALGELERGATSLELSGMQPSGDEPAAAERLAKALDGVYLDLAPVVLAPGAEFMSTSE